MIEATSPRSAAARWVGIALALALLALVAAQLLRRSEARRQAEAAVAVDGLLGATIEPVTAEFAATVDAAPGSGMVVTSVADDGPAARAGLSPGDVVERIDGRPVAAPARAARALARHAPPWRMTVRRHGKRRDLAVARVAPKPPA